MNAVCHVVYPIVNAFLPVPITRPPDRMCIEAPGTVIMFGLFFTVCALVVLGVVFAIARQVASRDTTVE